MLRNILQNIGKMLKIGRFINREILIVLVIWHLQLCRGNVAKI